MDVLGVCVLGMCVCVYVYAGVLIVEVLGVCCGCVYTGVLVEVLGVCVLGVWVYECVLGVCVYVSVCGSLSGSPGCVGVFVTT